ncbi:MAG: helix-turn-helix domain-containing protein, partial [Corynebacterium variabile]
FSADDVVGTALRLGLGTFSVAAVARELGVTTAAVYRRFPSHRDLLEECLSRILAEPDRSPRRSAGRTHCAGELQNGGHCA